MSRKAWLPSSLVCVFSLCAGLWTASCNLQVEIVAQVGTFVCDTDSQCPAEMFCDNYFNTYVYYSDIRGQPLAEGKWGFCSTEEYIIRREDLKNAEACSNDRDEDNDGKVDCQDPECQTAPHCRAWLESECADGEPAETCQGRLGFPLTRDGLNPDESNCPLSVGYYGYGLESDAANVCLPRCRLYLPSSSSGMLPSQDSDFASSDHYCDQIVAPGLITDASFEGVNFTCQHLEVTRNMMGRQTQNDVCLPETRVTDCAECVGATPRCLTVHYMERTLLAWSSSQDDVQPIGGYTWAELEKSANYCLPEN